MRLNEITPATNKNSGVYVAVKPTRASQKIILEFAKSLGVHNVVPSDKLHCTIIFSPTPPKKKIILTTDIYPVRAVPNELVIYPTNDGVPALVLTLTCKPLVDRHQFIMAENGTTYTYAKYQPHITISYDCGEFDASSYTGKLPSIEFENEYQEALNFDWAKTVNKK